MYVNTYGIEPTQDRWSNVPAESSVGLPLTESPLLAAPTPGSDTHCA